MQELERVEHALMVVEHVLVQQQTNVYHVQQVPVLDCSILIILVIKHVQMEHTQILQIVIAILVINFVVNVLMPQLNVLNVQLTDL